MANKTERVQSLQERIEKMATIDKKTGAVSDLENAFVDARPEGLSEAQFKEAMTYRADFIEAAAHVVVGAQLPIMKNDHDISALTSNVALFGRDTMSVTTDRKAGLLIAVTEHSVNPKTSTLKDLNASIRAAFLEESDEDKEKKAA